MTACKDSQATSGKKAVSATLAGVLAVGLVPAVALADEAVEVTEEDGITERVATEAQAFTNGTVKTAVSGLSGAAPTQAPDPAAISVQATAGKTVTVAPTVITTEAGNDVTVATVVGNDVVMEEGYTLQYFAANAEGKPTGSAISSVANPGKYCAVVTAASGKYAGGSIALPFTVMPASLGTLTAYEIDSANPADLDDEAFMFTGSVLNVGIKSDNTALKQGTDYTVKFLPDGANASDPAVTVKNAGTYFAVVTGQGIYAGETVELPSFEVKPFDLSKAVYNDGQTIATTSSAAPTTPQSVVSNDGDYAGTELSPSLVKLALQANSIWANNGEYTLNASAANAQDLDVNIVNSGTVKYDKVGTLASFRYDDMALPSSITINKAAGEAFDPADIAAFNGSTELDPSMLKFSFSKNGAPATSTGADSAATYTDAATYVVTVSVNTAAAPAGTGFAVGGTATTTVTVVTGAVDLDATAYVTYKTEPITSLTLPYASAGYAVADFGSVIKDSKGNSVAGTLTITDAEGAVVTTKLEDAGTYTITVTAAGYELKGTDTVKVTITPVDMTDASFVVDGTKIVASAFDKNYAYLDTTAAVTLDNAMVQYNAETDKAADPDWQALPAGVTATWQMLNDEGEWETVTTAAKDSNGEYRVVLAAADPDDKNYTFASDEGTILYISAGLKDNFQFADVVPGTWYYNVIAEAKADGLMKGYNGTSLFGPNDAITRGQVACVLFNMAGGSSSMDDSQYDENEGWVSFADVDGKMYYGQAIAWAKNAGVVHGYAGTDDFRPDATITREEFAAMLANYAVKNGSTLPADADALLADKTDGSEVSDWAKESVAWAVQNKVMGNGGFIAPFSSTTRAETAAMVVNYDNNVK